MEVARAEPAEAARDAGHHLAFEHGHAVLLQRMHETEIRPEFVVRDVGRECAVEDPRWTAEESAHGCRIVATL